MLEIFLLGIFAYLIIRINLWFKKLRFPIQVKKQKEDMRSCFPEYKIDENIIFVGKAKERTIIAELIAFDKLGTKEELRKNYLRKGDRFLSPTELLLFVLRYQNNKKLDGHATIVTTYAAERYSVIELFKDKGSWGIQIRKNNELSELLFFKRKFGDSFVNKFYLCIAKNPKNLWIRLLSVLCWIVFFTEEKIGRKVLK